MSIFEDRIEESSVESSTALYLESIMEMILLVKIEEMIRKNPNIAAAVLLAALQECAKAEATATTAPTYRVVNKALEKAYENFC